MFYAFLHLWLKPILLLTDQGTGHWSTHCSRRLNMQRLTGKVAIVTGASAGIGRATAKLFAAEGAKVVIAARREAELETLAAEIASEGGEAAFLAGDVQSEDFANALVALAASPFGRLDFSYNHAGTLGEMAPPSGTSEAGYSPPLPAKPPNAFVWLY